jgi:hypothetical protein
MTVIFAIWREEIDSTIIWREEIGNRNPRQFWREEIGNRNPRQFAGKKSAIEIDSSILAGRV